MPLLISGGAKFDGFEGFSLAVLFLACGAAAGVAGGVMLAQGISSLFHHNQQPQEIVEVIKEEPAQVSDQGNNGWGDDQRMAGNDSYGNDRGGFADADYNDDSSSFFGGDDDSFV